MRRIVCVGNRLRPDDAAGPSVFDQLSVTNLPADVEVVEGGLAGLDLLRVVEGSDRVVFVDQVSGAVAERGVAVLKAEDVAACAPAAYDHAAGLPYLLRVLPAVCAGPVPEVLVVGVAGTPDACSIERAAELAVRLACGEPPRSAWEPHEGSEELRWR